MKLPKHGRYPKELQVGEETYEVKFVSRIGKSRRTLGLCDSGARLIRIRKGLSQKETFLTFIHEVLHAIEFEYNVKITHDAVYGLEEGIGALLLHNF